MEHHHQSSTKVKARGQRVTEINSLNPDGLHRDLVLRHMAKSKAKILVVDDNSGIRAALKVLLPLHFPQVELIPSPKELVTKLADFRPDVVLLDMNVHTDIKTGNESQ